MIALDTNVVVRFLTRDDPAQAVRALALIETGAAFVPRTVVLETEWVLRTIYRFERDAIAAGLTWLLGLPGVEVEDRPTVARALDWSRKGLDFADALHLASSTQAEAFATFDRALQRKARGLAGTVPVVAP
ncbi:MAG TPA: type II toxin-antitoxin system VapC family toxin [Geminicoccaceae bacterium]|nr:type II toxin-antitoxin system VapC family toxin [Geminicoccaceae bacterium]